MAGSGLEAVLTVGQMPFLYGIGLLQNARRSGTDIGTEGEALCSHFRALSERMQYVEVNRWDPLLFRQARGSRKDQEDFYSKIWRLHMHLNRYIFFDDLGQLGILRLIEPKFAELEVDITLCFEAGNTHYKLIQDHVEGSDYHLLATDSHRRSPRSRDTSQDFQDGHFANGVD